MSYALEAMKAMKEYLERMREEGETDLRSVITRLDTYFNQAEEDENS